MSEERDYHLKKKDFVPLVGWWKYHFLGLDFLSKEGPFSKNHLYSFPRELGLVVYNTILFCSTAITAGVIKEGLEQLVK